MKIYDEISDNSQKNGKKIGKNRLFFLKSNEASQSMFIGATFYVLTSVLLPKVLLLDSSPKLSFI